MTIQTAVLMKHLLLGAMLDGLLVIFILHRIMQQQLLQKKVYLFLLGKEKQKKNFGGVLNKQLMAQIIGSQI